MSVCPHHCSFMWMCPHHFILQFHVNVSTPFYQAVSCQCPHHFTLQFHVNVSTPFYQAVSCQCVHTILHCSFIWMCPHHFTLQFHVNVSTPFYTAVSCECVHAILYCSFMWMCPRHFILQFHVNVSAPLYAAVHMTLHCRFTWVSTPLYAEGSHMCQHPFPLSTAGSHECVHTILHWMWLTWMCQHHFWLPLQAHMNVSTPFYTAESHMCQHHFWLPLQAHMNARFVILRVMLEAGEGLVSIERLTGEDGEPDLRVKLDRSKIISVGKPAIGNFLRKLQVQWLKLGTPFYALCLSSWWRCVWGLLYCVNLHSACVCMWVWSLMSVPSCHWCQFLVVPDVIVSSLWSLISVPCVPWCQFLIPDVISLCSLMSIPCVSWCQFLVFPDVSSLCSLMSVPCVSLCQFLVVPDVSSLCPLMSLPCVSWCHFLVVPDVTFFWSQMSLPCGHLHWFLVVTYIGFLWSSRTTGVQEHSRCCCGQNHVWGLLWRQWQQRTPLPQSAIHCTGPQTAPPHVCAATHLCARCVCVCVCVRERERKRESVVCVCVNVCVWAGVREWRYVCVGVCTCVCVCACVSVQVHLCVRMHMCVVMCVNVDVFHCIECNRKTIAQVYTVNTLSHSCATMGTEMCCCFSDGQVQLKSYEPTAAGLIESFVDRFPSPDVDAIVQELWEKDRPYFWSCSLCHREIGGPSLLLKLFTVLRTGPTPEHVHRVTEITNWHAGNKLAQFLLIIMFPGHRSINWFELLSWLIEKGCLNE